MVPGSLGLVAVEGIAFWSEVAEACLGVGVTLPVPPRAMFTIVVHPDMHICCSNNLHMLCICTGGGIGAQKR